MSPPTRLDTVQGRPTAGAVSPTMMNLAPAVFDQVSSCLAISTSGADDVSTAIAPAPEREQRRGQRIAGRGRVMIIPFDDGAPTSESFAALHITIAWPPLPVTLRVYCFAAACGAGGVRPRGRTAKRVPRRRRLGRRRPLRAGPRGPRARAQRTLTAAQRCAEFPAGSRAAMQAL